MLFDRQRKDKLLRLSTIGQGSATSGNCSRRFRNLCNREPVLFFIETGWKLPRFSDAKIEQIGTVCKARGGKAPLTSTWSVNLDSKYRPLKLYRRNHVGTVGTLIWKIRAITIYTSWSYYLNHLFSLILWKLDQSKNSRNHNLHFEIFESCVFANFLKNLFELKLDLLYFHEKMRSDRTASSANPHPHLNQNFRSLYYFMLGIDYFGRLHEPQESLHHQQYPGPLYRSSINWKTREITICQFLPCDCLNHVSSRKLKLYCIFTRKCGATASSAIRIPTWIKTSEVQGIQWFAI